MFKDKDCKYCGLPIDKPSCAAFPLNQWERRVTCGREWCMRLNNREHVRKTNAAKKAEQRETKIFVGIRLDKRLCSQLRRGADRQDVSVGKYATQLLTEALKGESNVKQKKTDNK